MSTEFDLDDHDKLIRLETQTNVELKNINGKLDDQKILMTNHLAHHQAIEEKMTEKKNDRAFKIISIIFQVAITVLLAWLIGR